MEQLCKHETVTEKFERLFEETRYSEFGSLSNVAKRIRFAIYEIPQLVVENPDDVDLQFKINSFMRRAFRDALRISFNDMHDCVQKSYANELAKQAGFHQYKGGDIVSIFKCAEHID